MPIENSIFRIVHRTKKDPHGSEGYFLHEIYVRENGTVTGWRAGLSLGRLTIAGLVEITVQMLDAFNHPVIEHKDLVKKNHYISDYNQTRLNLTEIHALLQQQSLPELNHEQS